MGAIHGCPHVMGPPDAAQGRSTMHGTRQGSPMSAPLKNPAAFIFPIKECPVLWANDTFHLPLVPAAPPCNQCPPQNGARCLLAKEVIEKVAET